MQNTYQYQPQSGKPVCGSKFGSLEFQSQKWVSGPKLKFNIHLDTLFECAVPHDEVVAYFVHEHGREIAIARRGNSLIFFFDPAALIRSHIQQKCLSQKQPFYMKIPFIYDLTTAKMHFFLFRFVTRMAQKSNRGLKFPYPDFPTDYSLLTLLDLLDQCKVPASECGVYRGAWPEGAKSAVCLSHDVDDYDGYLHMKNLLDVENEFGFKATYNIPGKRYSVDIPWLQSLEAEGFEFGLHGYKHRGETPFLPEPQIEARIQESLQNFKGLKMKGYRSPAMRRTEALLKVLGKYLDYDSSVADTENYTNGVEFNGCSIPFPYYVGNLLEIPINVPQDGVLLMLGHSPAEILSIWKEKINFLKSIGAPIIINTHPDPVFSGNPEMAGLYRRLLDLISKDSELHVMTLGTLNQWIRKQ